MQHALVLTDDHGADLHLTGRLRARRRHHSQQTRHLRLEASIGLFLNMIGDRAGKQVL